jgi:Putative MetA-pathway of phenol degradation
MGPAMLRQLALIFVLATGVSAYAQAPGSRVPASSDSESAGENQPAAPAPSDETGASSPSDSAANRRDMTLTERLQAVFSQADDPDGPINTDRPTFTPANTVVPLGRLQFESGFTFNYQPAGRVQTTVYDLPELAMRYGIFERAEFRTFWLGESFDEIDHSTRRSGRTNSGVSDMEVGFKWQLLVEDKERKWRPTTALITSIIAPTGGSSRFSDQTVEPYINLIYGWSLNDKLTLAGSTGYLGMRQQPPFGTIGRTDNFQRFHQSLVAFYTVGDRTTLFYEWYVLMFTGAPDNRPTHFMDGGVLYRLSPNIQVDLRAGFGLSGRPDDFFTGAGLSWRF